MKHTLILTLIAGAAMMALAGCTAIDGLTADAKVTYDGSSNGSHSDKAKCDAEGSLSGSGTIRDGSVLVTVEDGDGTTLYSHRFEGSIDLGRTRLDGDSGTWTLRAQRSGDDVLGDEFSGDYKFFLDCEGV